MISTTIHNEALLSHFQELASYHVWSTTRLTTWLRSKPGLLMENKASSSFPGIKATLLHMVEVEREWMGHLGVSPGLLQEGLEDDLGNVLDSMVAQARLLADYVAGLNEAELASECTWRLLFAGEMTLARKDILQHCLNHSTYHRGQIVTIGHQLGLKDAPMTDYLFYCLKVKKGEVDRMERSDKRVPATAVTYHPSERRPFLAVNFFSR